MNAEDVQKVLEAGPRATVIASHMEATNLCVLSRAELRRFAQETNTADRLLIPDDNQSYTF